MRYIVLGVVMVVLMGCGKTQPQRPTFHGSSHVDSTAVGAMMLNQRMAEEADKQLTHYADSGYVLMENNVWARGLQAVEDTLRGKDFVQIEARIYNLQDSLLTTHQSHSTVDKVDDIQAIVQILPHLHKSDSVSLIAPWYMAFGSAGNGDILPYENVRIELKISE